MAEDSAGTPAFPMVCAKCGACEARPFSVSTVPDQPTTLLVQIRCGACEHVWSSERSTTTGTWT